MVKKFRVILAFDFYSVGDVIEPVGLWRDSLLSRGYIEPVLDTPRYTELEPEPKRKRKKNELDAINESL